MKSTLIIIWICCSFPVFATSICRDAVSSCVDDVYEYNNVGDFQPLTHCFQNDGSDKLVNCCTTIRDYKALRRAYDCAILCFNQNSDDGHGGAACDTCDTWERPTRTRCKHDHCDDPWVTETATSTTTACYTAESTESTSCRDCHDRTTWTTTTQTHYTPCSTACETTTWSHDPWEKPWQRLKARNWDDNDTTHPCMRSCLDRAFDAKYAESSDSDYSSSIRVTAPISFFWTLFVYLSSALGL